MISIENSSGDLIKIFKNSKSQNIGFHKLFGLISVENANKRMIQREKSGFEYNNDEWLCQFNLGMKNNKVHVSNIENCEIAEQKSGQWNLKTKNGNFKISSANSASIQALDYTNNDKNEQFEKISRNALYALMMCVPFLFLLQEEEVIEEIEKPLEVITVKVVKPVNTVKITQTASKNIKVKPLTKAQKSKRAVKRNLGFLGLVGSKNLSKVNGGVPQKLKAATAGAGAGGDAGSGGEVLTGLGKGLKKTTVGNTGVAGLGGVGTKGAGGGKGGYGNTMVASGEGTGITGISVASNDMVLDGGLSRYAINATIAKYLSQVRRCYESQLNKTPDIEGLVSVAFEIGGNGKLNYSRIAKSSLGSKAVEKCITTKMMKWKFPKPKGGVNVKVNYPFMLRPVGT
jgi:hypothetical protein